MLSIYSLIYEILAVGYISDRSKARLKGLVADDLTPETDELLLLLRQAIAFGHVKCQSSAAWLSKLK